MATDGRPFWSLSCITLTHDIPETNSTDSSPTWKTLTTNREQVRSLANAVAGLRTWHALKPNTTPSDTKQHDKNSYATDQCVIGADEQKQQSLIT